MPDSRRWLLAKLTRGEKFGLEHVDSRKYDPLPAFGQTRDTVVEYLSNELTSNDANEIYHHVARLT